MSTIYKTNSQSLPGLGSLQLETIWRVPIGIYIPQKL